MLVRRHIGHNVDVAIWGTLLSFLDVVYPIGQYQNSHATFQL